MKGQSAGSEEAGARAPAQAAVAGAAVAPTKLRSTKQRGQTGPAVGGTRAAASADAQEEAGSDGGPPDANGRGRQLRSRSATPAFYVDTHPFDDWLGGGSGSSDAEGGGAGRGSLDVAALRGLVEGRSPGAPRSEEWGLGAAGTSPAQLASLVQAQGFRRPVVLRPHGKDAAAAEQARAALGMRLPAAVLTLGGLAAALGAEHQAGLITTRVPTIDVRTQELGPRMSMEQLYFATPAARHRRLLNVVSLSLADTALEEEVVPPELVRQLDLMAACWPEEEQPRPETLLYALFGPQGAYTDFHVDMGGSSVWYHVVSGTKVFLAAPPTPANLAEFETWCSGKQQRTSPLAGRLDGCLRVWLGPGDTLLLPGGWPHAVSTPRDSLVYGEAVSQWLLNRVNSNLERVARTAGFRFPLFLRLLWHAARRALDVLRQALSTDQPPASLGLSAWERQGLPALADLLRERLRQPQRGGSGSHRRRLATKLQSPDQAGEAAGQPRGDAPPGVEDPAALLDELELVLEAADTRWPSAQEQRQQDGAGVAGPASLAAPGGAAAAEGGLDEDSSWLGIDAILDPGAGSAAGAVHTASAAAPGRQSTVAMQAAGALSLRGLRQQQQQQRDAGEAGGGMALIPLDAAVPLLHQAGAVQQGRQDQQAGQEQAKAARAGAPVPGPTTGAGASRASRRQQQQEQQRQQPLAQLLAQRERQLRAQRGQKPAPKVAQRTRRAKQRLQIEGESDSYEPSAPSSSEGSSASEGDGEAREQQRRLGSGRQPEAQRQQQRKRQRAGAEPGRPAKPAAGAEAGASSKRTAAAAAPSKPAFRIPKQAAAAESGPAAAAPPALPADLKPLGRKHPPGGTAIMIRKQQGSQGARAERLASNAARGTANGAASSVPCMQQQQPQQRQQRGQGSAAPAVASRSAPVPPATREQQCQANKERAAAVAELHSLQQLRLTVEREEALLASACLLGWLGPAWLVPSMAGALALNPPYPGHLFFFLFSSFLTTQARVDSGAVSLPDCGRRLRASLAQRRRELAERQAAVEGRVFTYTDEGGLTQGPFSQHQLRQLQRAGLLQEGSVIKHPRQGQLTLAAVLSLPEPATAALLREQQAGQQAPSGEGTQQPEVSCARPQRAGLFFERQQEQEKQQQQQAAEPKPDAAGGTATPRSGGASAKRSRPGGGWQQRRWQQEAEWRRQQEAWEQQAAEEAALDETPEGGLWCFTNAQREQEGPYSVAELRALFHQGGLTEDVMVHDEDAGVSLRLFSLLGYSQLAASSRQQRQAEAQTRHPPPPPQQQQQQPAGAAAAAAAPAPAPAAPTPVAPVQQPLVLPPLPVSTYSPTYSPLRDEGPPAGLAPTAASAGGAGGFPPGPYLPLPVQQPAGAPHLWAGGSAPLALAPGMPLAEAAATTLAVDWEDDEEQQQKAEQHAAEQQAAPDGTVAAPEGFAPRVLPPELAQRVLQQRASDAAAVGGGARGESPPLMELDEAALIAQHVCDTRGNEDA
eukprot:scaffold14.g1123.t1